MESTMSDVDGKPKVTNFKKRAHRPWETSLLETAVKNSENTISEESLDFNLDSNTDSFYNDFALSTDNEAISLSPSLQHTFSQLQAIAVDDEQNSDLKIAIKQGEQQKNRLREQISDKSSSSILLGGFFQPQHLAAPTETQSTRKMNFLLSDLKSKEQELNSLTSNLKVTEAVERAEQAELNRRAEEHRRLAAEHRMRQAIEQAQVAAEQCKAAMDQANQAALAHREEEQHRHMAEGQIRDLKLRITNAELSLQNERAAKIAAEEAAQQAIMQAQDALHKTSLSMDAAKKSEETKRIELEHKLDVLNKAHITLEFEFKESQNKISALEANLKDTIASYNEAQNKIAELNAQREKLKSIVEAEQDLRKAAEKRGNDALLRAEAAEKACAAEEQQRKLTDERAKRAVEHANRTVMHLLNAPLDNEYNLRSPGETKEKMKVKIMAEATTKAPEPADDDYSF